METGTRRTQQQRSEATRGAILDAAIVSLVTKSSTSVMRSPTRGNSDTSMVSK